MSNLNVRPIAAPAKHAAPNLQSIDPKLRGIYSSSPSNLDSNLLIMFHGLGDTPKPFADLGKSLNLPQTAVLSLQAPEQIPLLEEEAFAWWSSFDPLGERKFTQPIACYGGSVTNLYGESLKISFTVIPNPNPSTTLELLMKLIIHLTAPAPAPAWSPSQIHLFGFAQGATAAAELALLYTRKTRLSFGSIVSVSGALLSHPTLAEDKKSETPVLIIYRTPEERLIGIPIWKRGFKSVKSVKLSGTAQSMLRRRDEWIHAMKFWSEVLVQNSLLSQGSDVFEVTGGISAATAAGAKPT